jgi:hypothetical protein
MADSSGQTLSVTALFAERDARRRSDQEAAEQLQRRKEEELAAFKQRLENFRLTDEIIKSGQDRIRRSFERGGRAVINAGVPPINKPSKEGAAKQSEQPDWLLTMPAGVRKVHEYWRSHLKPGGFGFAARVISYPGGKPRDVGLFFSWPKSALET